MLDMAEDARNCARRAYEMAADTRGLRRPGDRPSARGMQMLRVVERLHLEAGHLQDWIALRRERQAVYLLRRVDDRRDPRSRSS